MRRWSIGCWLRRTTASAGGGIGSIWPAMPIRTATRSTTRGHIWPYRDWVIDALNRDMPFDQFTIEQIAGDLLPNPTQRPADRDRLSPQHADQRRGRHRSRAVSRAKRWSIASTRPATVLLGLTLGCARCHDHKYDPITQREFYQLFAFFNSTDEITKESERPEHNRPKLEFPTPEQAQARNQYSSDLFELNDTIAERLSQLVVRPGASADVPADASVGEDEELRNFSRKPSPPAEPARSQLHVDHARAAEAAGILYPSRWRFLAQGNPGQPGSAGGGVDRNPAGGYQPPGPGEVAGGPEAIR